MRFCGHCGAPVAPDVRTTGACAACGTRIAPSGDVLDVLDAHSTAATLYAAPGAAASAAPLGSEAAVGRAAISTAPAGSNQPRAARSHSGSAFPTSIPPWPTPPRPRRSRAGLTVVALLLVVALLATALIALTSRPRHGLAQSLPTATTAVSATQTSALATATSVLQPSPTDVPTAMPTASPTAGDTPELTVNPANPPPSPAVCANSTAQFTVSNTGGGTLEWTATASDPLYALDPSSGTLASGDAPQTVSVSHIMLSGTISVTDPNANGSPQTVTITCA